MRGHTLRNGAGPQIFISYRRSDSAGHARALYGELKRRLGGEILFFDRETIESGDDFPERLRAAAVSCAVCLVLIGPEWLDARTELGERRLDRANDYVRQEIASALQAGRFLVPVLFDDVTAPSAEQLPEILRPLGSRDALTLAGKQYEYDAQVEKLVQRVVSALPNPPSLTASPTKYLMWLRDQHSFVEIRGMGAMVAQRMELTQVYTRLSVSGGGAVPRRAGDNRNPRDRTATMEEWDRVLQDGDAARAELHNVLQANPHAAIIGDPGSGKTTFLRYTAQLLASAQLGDGIALAGLGLFGDAPFPIFVRLADLSTFLAASPRADLADDAEEHLCRYLNYLLAGQPHGLPSGYLRDRVHDGGCMLLLDGLDEVPGEASRERMVRLLEHVVAFGKQVGNRHLITCRTRAYEGRVQLAGDVASLRLLPFGPDEVREFTESWARALFHVTRGAPDDAPGLREAIEYRDQLRAAIAENPSGTMFAESPLMLTVLAVVHWSDRQLPEERAELYDRAVKYLLDTRKGQSMFQSRLRQECLQAIALAMFEHPKGVQRSISRLRATEAVARQACCSTEDAARFVEEEELHSGLLVARPEGLEFWHLTFQEYLTALAFSPLKDEKWKRLRLHLDDDRWNEVFLLLAGCERRNGLEETRDLVARVLSTGTNPVSNARAVALVSRMLRDVAPSGGDASHETDYAERLQRTLGILDFGGETVEERVRIEVGVALGRVGDPRLRDGEANKVTILGGTFWMGAQPIERRGLNYDDAAHDNESPVHQVTVSAFRIGRYPVTVGEFMEFLEAGAQGYLARANWTEEGWQWRKETSRSNTRYWSNRTRVPNRPVTEVSWYEAAAFATWVGGRLPTEAEWEWVARGASGRKHPWGSEPPTDRHFNFALRDGEPSPVGVYPENADQNGVRDLCSNVWEWCRDRWSAYEDGHVIDPTGPRFGLWRVLRGGDVRGASRIYKSPASVTTFVGFRVAWAPSRARA